MGDWVSGLGYSLVEWVGECMSVWVIEWVVGRGMQVVPLL